MNNINNKSRKGMVLVITLILLTAALLIGVILMQSVNLEVRMGGNEKRYISDEYSIEGIVRCLIDDFDDVVTDPDFNTSDTVCYVTDKYIPKSGDTCKKVDKDSSFYNCMLYPGEGTKDYEKLTLEFKGGGNPPRGYGYSLNTIQGREYVIKAWDQDTNSTVESGIWKALPK